MTGDIDNARGGPGLLLHRALSKQIIEAFYQVHFELGAGHVASVYSASLAIMLTELGVRFEREAPLAVHFHGLVVGSFRADMIVEDRIILELKAGSRLETGAEAQLLNYLRVTDIEVGLLLHFGSKAAFKRRVMSNERKSLRVSAANPAYLAANGNQASPAETGPGEQTVL